MNHCREFLPVYKYLLVEMLPKLNLWLDGAFSDVLQPNLNGIMVQLDF